jgi:peptidoglycan-N-acetylglucosamine deacetylase
MPKILRITAGITIAGAVLTALPTLLVALAQSLSPDVVFFARTTERTVALTIDDGPSAATFEILDVLAEHDVQATFFVIGAHVEEHREQLEGIRLAGHELAHHMLRDEPSIELPADTFISHFERVDSLLQGLGGSRYFRPASGWYNERMLREAARRGYRTVLGSVYPFDAQLPFPRVASWYMLQKVSPGDVLVLHDGPERGRRTAEVLRRVLPELHRRGYTVVPVSRLLEPRR